MMKDIYDSNWKTSSKLDDIGCNVYAIIALYFLTHRTTINGTLIYHNVTNGNITYS